MLSSAILILLTDHCSLAFFNLYPPDLTSPQHHPYSSTWLNLVTGKVQKTTHNPDNGISPWFPQQIPLCTFALSRPNWTKRLCIIREIEDDDLPLQLERERSAHSSTERSLRNQLAESTYLRETAHIEVAQLRHRHGSARQIMADLQRELRAQRDRGNDLQHELTRVQRSRVIAVQMARTAQEDGTSSRQWLSEVLRVSLFEHKTRR